MSEDQPILPADPLGGYLAAKDEIDSAIRRVLSSGWYILGREVESFEEEFAKYIGAGWSVGVATCTDGIELALRALDVGPGDRVATVANTVTATVSAIVESGAEPVFIDIDPKTMLMSPGALEERLAREKIKAVVPVHLYGQACDMARIMAVARRHGALVVEDCAQAHGAKFDGKRVGAWGDLAAFSFYPTKNLGGFGDGGGVTGSDAKLGERVRRLRQYGWGKRYMSVEKGRNSRLDEIQAAILRVRLRRLDQENAGRGEIAELYSKAIKPAGIRLPSSSNVHCHVWHQYVVRCARRDELKQKLEDVSINCGVLYPVPVHKQPGYAQQVSLPETEKACAEVLSLPLYPSLKRQDAERVIAAVNRIVASL